ncbi:MAG: hypothetical protein ACI304_07250 [Lepagella sp.]
MIKTMKIGLVYMLLIVFCYATVLADDIEPQNNHSLCENIDNGVETKMTRTTSEEDGTKSSIRKYVIGDTIHIDGFHCMVIQTIEDGCHGLALSYPGYDDKQWEKRIAEFENNQRKALKKGEITETEFTESINDYKNQKHLYPIEKEKGKGGWILKRDEFEQGLNPGWRIPNVLDYEVINKFMLDYTGNKTANFHFRPQFMKKIGLPMEWKINMHEILLNGFIGKEEFAVKRAGGGQWLFYQWWEFPADIKTICIVEF